jgi:MOSC domain-containing protein YiiM
MRRGADGSTRHTPGTRHGKAHRDAARGGRGPGVRNGRLALKGYAVAAGQLGENITTRDVDLLGLPTGTLLRLGELAVVEVTGLRNPCAKINDFRPGLLGEVCALDPVSGDFTFTSGVMAVVRRGGPVRPYDAVEVELPPLPHRPLERV